jgi:hypothetical protein
MGGLFCADLGTCSAKASRDHHARAAKICAQSLTCALPRSKEVRGGSPLELEAPILYDTPTDALVAGQSVFCAAEDHGKSVRYVAVVHL